MTQKHELSQQQYNNLQKLISALRSNKYKQGVGYLRRDDCYCCLGVACDLFSCDRWRLQGNIFTYLDYQHILPLEVRHYYGFPSEYGCIFEDYDLVYLNDAGMPFFEIANKIEYWIQKECEIVN